ncbi:MAG: HNH endonuclease [Chloroflexi bacterium]|nr:HNH endonuclease [Chloroflexota bacterium]
MVAILLLNASYEPLSVIPKRRALSLLLRERVDGVTEDVIALRGISRTLHIPSVLKLRRYVNVPRRGAQWSRPGVMKRDNYTCVYCGVRAGEVRHGHRLRHNDFTLDHILPKSRGGRNTWMNTACACPDCNGRKDNRTPHEAGMPLLWEPKTPRVDYIVASGKVPEAWKFYLET